MSAIVLALVLSAAASQQPRWQMPDGQIAYRPICRDYRAPLLPAEVPESGLVPALVYKVDGVTDEEEAYLRSRIAANGFALGGGTATINDVRVLVAFGQGVLKTQRMADSLYAVMCGIEGTQARLVHMRYNLSTEFNRVN